MQTNPILRFETYSPWIFDQVLCVATILLPTTGIQEILSPMAGVLFMTWWAGVVKQDATSQGDKPLFFMPETQQARNPILNHIKM